MERHRSDLSQQHTTPVRGKPNVHRVDHGWKMFPFDLPIQATIETLIDETQEHAPDRGIFSKRLLGWEVSLHCFSIPADVTLTIWRNSNGPYRLEVRIDDEVIKTIERDDEKQARYLEENDFMAPGDPEPEEDDDEIIFDDDEDAPGSEEDDPIFD